MQVKRCLELAGLANTPVHLTPWATQKRLRCVILTNSNIDVVPTTTRMLACICLNTLSLRHPDYKIGQLLTIETF